MTHPDEPRDRDPDEPGGRRPRRLAQPPSERFPPEAADPESGRRASASRTVPVAVLLALAGAASIVVLGGFLAVSAGLVAVAALIGWVTGGVLRPTEAGPRAALAMVLAVGAIGLGQLGLWGFAWLEGGRLGLLDYLAQTFGVLVPAEVAAAALVAWASAR